MHLNYLRQIFPKLQCAATNLILKCVWRVFVTITEMENFVKRKIFSGRDIFTLLPAGYEKFIMLIVLQYLSPKIIGSGESFQINEMLIVS